MRIDTIQIIGMFAIAAALGLATTSYTAVAQDGDDREWPDPWPPGVYPCLGGLNDAQLEELARESVAAELSLQSTVASRANADLGGVEDWVTLSWSRDYDVAEALCIWVQQKTPGYDYYLPGAMFILPPAWGDYSFKVGGNPGEYCYRATVITKTARSPFSETCVRIENPALPIPPAGPAPPDVGTGLASDPAPNAWQLGLAGALAVTAGVLLAAPALRRRSRVR